MTHDSKKIVETQKSVSSQMSVNSKSTEVAKSFRPLRPTNCWTLAVQPAANLVA